MPVVSWCSAGFVLFCVFVNYWLFAMVPLNMTCLHCLQHSFFEHLFNLYYTKLSWVCQHNVATLKLSGAFLQSCFCLLLTQALKVCFCQQQALYVSETNCNS